MTKKVLISLDDMKNLWDDPDVYGMRDFRNLFEKWFDAQPDIMDVMYAVGDKYIKQVLSKMETTDAKE